MLITYKLKIAGAISYQNQPLYKACFQEYYKDVDLSEFRNYHFVVALMLREKKFLIIDFDTVTPEPKQSFALMYATAFRTKERQNKAETRKSSFGKAVRIA